MTKRELIHASMVYFSELPKPVGEQFMADFSLSKGFWRALLKPRHLLQILLWPFFCLIVAALLWGMVIHRTGIDQQRMQDNLLSQTAALSRALAKGLSLSVSHVDQLSSELQLRWERSGPLHVPNPLVYDSAYGREWLSFMGIADRDGRVISGNAAAGGLPTMAGEDYFQYHRTNPSRALHIGSTRGDGGRRLPAIVFSRRLDGPGGAFNGVVVLGVRPSYLTSFYDEASFGKGGYLGIRSVDAELDGISVGGAVAAHTPLLRVRMALGAPAGARALQVPDRFGHNDTQLLAWQQIGPYPLFVVVGLAASEVLAPYRSITVNYTRGATLASWFLALSALIGSLSAVMLVWRKEQAQEIRDAYRLATEGANEGFFFLRALHGKDGGIVDFLIEDCNRTGAALAGVKREQLVGIRLSALPDISDLMVAAEMPSQIAIGRKAMKEGLVQDEWAAAPSSSFRGLWLHRTIRRVGSGLAITLRDISSAKAHEQNLLALANEDALTKLPNRHWLMTNLPSALARARQNQGQLALFFIDIDNFKQVNDTLGHGAGDALLHVAAMRLKAELRPGDCLARLGGDEFTIVLEQIATAHDAQLVAARIVDAFRHPIELGSGTATVGSSIGISLYPGDGEDIDTLLRHADIAMYAAKAAGKGRFCFFEREQYQSMMERIETQIALESAVHNDQFVMYYQPRLSSDSGRICGMEALVRWQHPVRGLLAPKEFIALAESSGLIVTLGKMVMEMVCTQIEEWMAMELPLVPVSFNVSAFEFNNGDVRAQLERCIERHHIHPHEVEIELTESTLVDEKSDAINALAALRKMGVKCLVDDFGTGFSSLSQLQRLDTDILKIDQSFTAQLGRTKKAETFFRAIVSMADALEMGVVAEGVETIEQLHLLQLLGCKEVQGYYMCPPVPGAVMAELLRKRFMMTREGVLL